MGGGRIDLPADLLNHDVLTMMFEDAELQSRAMHIQEPIPGSVGMNAGDALS